MAGSRSLVKQAKCFPVSTGVEQHAGFVELPFEIHAFHGGYLFLFHHSSKPGGFAFRNFAPV